MNKTVELNITVFINQKNITECNKEVEKLIKVMSEHCVQYINQWY